MLYEYWTLSLIERTEIVKLSIYFLRACVKITPQQPAIANKLFYALTNEEPLSNSTPRSQRVGGRDPCFSLPPELQNMGGGSVGSRAPEIIQKPVGNPAGRSCRMTLNLYISLVAIKFIVLTHILFMKTVFS